MFLNINEFYNFTFQPKESLFEKDVAELGYYIYLLGHDHSVYPLTKVFDSLIVRSGSLLRGTSSFNDMNREVYIVDILINGSDFEINPIKVPIEKDVFILTENKKKSIDFTSVLDSLFNNVSVGPEKERLSVIAKFVNELQDDQLKTFVKSLLLDKGISV